MEPLVSIVLPCYNIENELKRCIQSILDQTHSNFEALFINDGSTDNTVDVFNSLNLDSRFVLHSKKNEGSGLARNDGLKLSKGKYVYFMDPDDAIDPTLIEDNVNSIMNHNADLNIFGYRQKSETIGEIVTKEPENGMLLDSKIKIQEKLPKLPSMDVNISAVWNKFYNKDFLVENDIQFTNLPIGQDFEFNWQVYDYAEKINIIPKLYYTYFSGRFGSARTKYSSKKYESEKKILDTMINKSKKWNLESEYKHYINGYKLNMVFTEIRNLEIITSNPLIKLKSDSLYNNVINLNYRDVPFPGRRIQLFVLKHPSFLKGYLKYKY